MTNKDLTHNRNVTDDRSHFMDCDSGYNFFIVLTDKSLL